MECRYESHKRRLQEVNQHQDLAILRRARIVGTTTSGLAMNQTLFTSLAPKVLSGLPKAANRLFK